VPGAWLYRWYNKAALKILETAAAASVLGAIGRTYGAAP
jgi:hypothetical protein